MTDTSTKPALHHVAFACRDLDETHHFYHDLLGLELVHTEVKKVMDGWFTHVFYDLGDGSAVAFFKLRSLGEPDELKTAISDDLGLPTWVNHLALRYAEAEMYETTSRLQEDGLDPFMVVDHDWCRSIYFTDPNGILIEMCTDTPGLPVDPEAAERLRHATPETAKA
jgi:glyoxylase I family protein